MHQNTSFKDAKLVPVSFIGDLGELDSHVQNVKMGALTKTAESKIIESNACKNGTCPVTWKPQRPAA